MTARQRLVDELTAALPAAYRVTGRTATPEQIDPGTLAVRVFASTVAPGPNVRGLAYTLTVWAVTGSADPDRVDDVLDDALDELLRAFLAMTWLTLSSAERAVMGDDDGPAWHGYRFTLTAYATITED